MTISYEDIHKPINDLLNRDYPKGMAGIEIRTVTQNGVNFTITGQQDTTTGFITSELMTSYNDFKNGLLLTQTWNTSNIFGLKAEIADKIAPGLKVEVDTLLLPKENNVIPKATVSYVGNNINAKLLADVFNGPEFLLKTVMNKNGILFGAESSFSMENISFKRYNATVGYANNEYVATLQSSQNLDQYEASFIHNVGIATQVGARAIYNKMAADQPVAIEVGSAHKLDNNTSIRAKINSIGQVGLGISHILSPGIKATVGASIDTQSIQSKFNSLGFSLVLDC